jgi:hypothetical protein
MEPALAALLPPAAGAGAGGADDDSLVDADAAGVAAAEPSFASTSFSMDMQVFPSDVV